MPRYSFVPPRPDYPAASVAHLSSAALMSLPTRLLSAFDALYGHYEKVYALWEQEGIGVPPVFIVVCNNTSSSKLVYDYISGFERTQDDGTAVLENGRLPLFRNYDSFDNRLARPRTLLIDSEQLESGEALDKATRHYKSRQFRYVLAILPAITCFAISTHKHIGRTYTC